MDIDRELMEIGSLMASAGLLMSVREEVSKVMREGFVVTDGDHCSSGQGYNVVVRCGDSQSGEVARRIRANIKNVNVDRIAEGVLGVKTARRGGRNHGK